MAKPRGRPRLDRHAVDADQTIARTVDRLVMWAYPEGQVLKCVASAAKDVLRRTNSHGGSLSPHSIEAIWKRHRPPGWEKYWPADMLAALGRPKWRRMWTSDSLRARRPSGKNIRELAEVLLGNRGMWPQPTERVWSPVDHEWWDAPLSAGPQPDLEFAKGSGVEKSTDGSAC